VRELKVRLTSFEKLVDERFASFSKEMDTRFGAIDTRFAAMDARFAAMEERLDAQAKQHEAQFHAIMSAISESRAQADLAGMREIGQLRERVAVIESRLPAKAS
jgi:predicted  nucleic acid-binding Zn-ribbon protein